MSLSTRRRPFTRWLVLGLAVGGWIVWSGQGSQAELSKPGANERNICSAVTRLMDAEHLLRHPLDDEISERCLTLFLKTLDPWKVYFLQTDVDEFREQKDQIDDQLRDRNIEFAYTIFERFLKRIDERVAEVPELLRQEHDFSIDEEIVNDPDLAEYAPSTEEARDIWRRRIKFDLLNVKVDRILAEKKAKERAEKGQPPEANDAEAGDPIERLARRYVSFAKRMHQTDSDELLEMYLTSLTSAYDPHTSFMSPGTLENFEIYMRLNLDGIGATLRYDDGYTIVEELVPGGAAANSGLIKPKDRIIGVGEGAEGEVVDTQDMKLNDVVKRVRGKRGTVVRLRIIPSGSVDSKVINITRAKIELTTSEARSKVLTYESAGRDYKIGVIDVPSFYMDMEAARAGKRDFKSLTRDTERLLAQMRDREVDALVLDLRRNGGGSLTEAINFTGLFLKGGPVVQVKDKDGEVEPFNDPDSDAAWDGPLVVLTSKFSASASEIFAGAVQDYGRGLIVGDHSTHGKGTVQTLLDLSEKLFPGMRNAPKLGALKLTIQQFYRPSGDSTQARGVLADIEFPSLSNHLRDVNETDLDFALPFDQVKEAPFRKSGVVDADAIIRLNELSQARRSESKDFDRLERNIQRYEQQRGRKAITLNEEKYLAEREDLNADAEEERENKELNETDRDVFDAENYYNREVLAVTADFLRLSGAKHAKAASR